MNVALIWIFPVDLLNFASARVANICTYTLCDDVATMHNLHIFVKYNSFGNPDSERGELHIFTVLPIHRNRKQL